MKSIPLPILTLLCAGLMISGLAAQEHYDITLDEDYYYLQFDETNGVPIEEFIDLCKEITGYAIKYTKQEVEAQFILILGVQKVKRDKKSFFEYFQAVMVSYDFICSGYGPEEAPYFITVQKLTGATQRSGVVQSQAPIIERQNLDDYKDNPGMLITTTIPLKFVAARDMMQTLSQMVGAGGPASLESVRFVENANSLVITSFATKVWGMSKLCDLMDVEPFKLDVKTEQRELLYAVADELEPVLTNLIQATLNLRPGQQPQARTTGVLREIEPKIIPEPRTNSLLFTGSDDDIKNISRWIDILDVEVDPRGDIHVYRLKNTLAKEMEEVLKTLIEGQQQAGAARPPGTTGAVQPGSLEAPAHVVADEPSNSLIITASKTKYAQLLEVIKLIDIRRRQVLIECAAVELQTRIDEALGVELGALDLKVDNDGNLITDDYTRPWGFSSFGLSEFTTNPDTGFPDQRIPVIGQGFTGGIFNGQDFAIPFLLYALSKNQNANILQMPSILTNDNEEALIKAIDKQPTFVTTQGQVSDQTSFDDYEEAGITLQISPSISAGNYLKLYVNVELSSFDEASSLSPPPKSERTIETSVTIPDGHTLIIGGVLVDNTTEASSKVPFFGDLPIVGWLFRSRSETNRKVNLYVFITPHIIGDDFANLDEISTDKKKEVDTLTGKVLLIDPDFEYTNTDKRVIDAGANWIFEIPSYASPDTGEVDMDYLKPPAAADDNLGEQ